MPRTSELEIRVRDLPTEFPYCYEPMGKVVLDPGERVSIYGWNENGGTHVFAWVTDRKEKGISDGVWYYWLTDVESQPALF